LATLGHIHEIFSELKVVRRLESPAIFIVVKLRARESIMIDCTWRKRSARNEEIQCEVIGVKKEKK
jgi:aminoglycoside N3'-acetyltransferase